MIYVVTNCTAEKLKVAAPARELYRGPSVRRVLKVVDKARAGGRPISLYIISARYGLIHEDQIVEPYDETLSGRTVEEIKTWAATRGVLDRFKQLADVGTVVFTATKPYYTAVEDIICKRDDIYVLSPYRACGKWVKTGNFDKHIHLAKLLLNL